MPCGGVGSRKWLIWSGSLQSCGVVGVVAQFNEHPLRAQVRRFGSQATLGLDHAPVADAQHLALLAGRPAPYAA